MEITVINYTGYMEWVPCNTRFTRARPTRAQFTRAQFTRGRFTRTRKKKSK